MSTIVIPPTIIEPAGVKKWGSMDGDREVPYHYWTPNQFPEGDRDLIPHDIFYVETEANEVYRILVDLWLGRTPMVWGPPGAGKTYVAEKIAEIVSKPHESLAIGETSEREDVTFHHELIDGETKQVLSRLVRALSLVYSVNVDEWNTAPPAVHQPGRPLLDGRQHMALDGGDGRIIQRNPYFHMVMTANPDWHGNILGVAPMSEADLARLGHLYMDYPSHEIEWKIIEGHKHRFPDVKNSALACAMLVFNDIRELWNKEETQVSGGTRELLAFCAYLMYHDPDVALSCVYERMAPDQWQPIEALVAKYDFARMPEAMKGVCR